MKILFKEEQRFNQWWLKVILIGLGIIPTYGIYKQLILKEAFGDHPMSDIRLIVFSLSIYSLIVFLLIIKLKTEITSSEITIRFYPLLKKKVYWHEIESAKVVNYGFVGGWGIRLWTAYGTVYNIKGKMGLAIKMKDGKKILIGTQKEIELKSVIIKKNN